MADRRNKRFQIKDSQVKKNLRWHILRLLRLESSTKQERIGKLNSLYFGYWKVNTKIPHSGHVLISTWASLFHIIMAVGASLSVLQMIGIFVFLFLAVWLPCCTSDIVYPLLFPTTLKHKHKKKDD